MLLAMHLWSYPLRWAAWVSDVASSCNSKDQWGPGPYFSDGRYAAGDGRTRPLRGGSTNHGQWRAHSEGAGGQCVLGQRASEIGVHRRGPQWREGPKPSLWGTGL